MLRCTLKIKILFVCLFLNNQSNKENQIVISSSFDGYESNFDRKISEAITENRKAPYKCTVRHLPLYHAFVYNNTEYIHFILLTSCKYRKLILFYCTVCYFCFLISKLMTLYTFLRKF